MEAAPQTAELSEVIDEHPQLPPELMLEIASFLLDAPYVYIGQREERKMQLKICRALSHSCRIFRAIFIPHLWNSVDDFFADGGDDLSLRLDVRMREITQAEYLVNHVKVISLSLHGPALSNPDRAAAFIACLRAFSNLEALKIVSLAMDRPINTQNSFEYIYNAFRPHAFLSVARLVLPDALAPILSSFPRARSIFCGEDRPTAGFRLIRAAKNYCPKLEEVVYGGSSRVMIGWISVATPNIQRLILRNTLFEEDFVFMRTMTNLIYLEFAHREDVDQLFPSLADCEKQGRALLSISRNPAPKKLRIVTLKGRTETVLRETVIDLP
ncbi:hypothetical protein C8F04DRAFT_1070059 [Mycena alexandri]|uniref:Uncharacterized protein n=1 Tax=Mycena alexandri TaxID=1745969 RepID=A0AAD6TD61_9AGAR|nr:hypothetical protein C8F04DRAFT_1070059 [Mycena alexandri]